jgi:hypothetical protein
MGLKEVLEAIQLMSPEEQEQVRAFLDTLPGVPTSPEEEAQARLLSEIGPTAAAGRIRHTPVGIKGRPLSDTLVGERR